jgi:hypothetical protein
MTAMTRRFAAVAIALSAAAGLLAGCTNPDKSTTEPAPKEFCDAFTRLDDKLSDGKATQQDQYDLVKETVGLAPEAIKPDGETFLEGYQRLQNGEPPESVRKDEAKYQRASLNFQRWGNQHCGFYKRKSSI